MEGEKELCGKVDISGKYMTEKHSKLHGDRNSPAALKKEVTGVSNTRQKLTEMMYLSIGRCLDASLKFFRVKAELSVTSPILPLEKSSYH